VPVSRVQPLPKPFPNMLSSKPNTNYNALHYNLWRTGKAAMCLAS